MPDFSGKTALVTGASRGLGRHIALRLARERMNVVLAARDDAGLHAVAAEVTESGGTPLVYRLDVRDRAALDACMAATAARFGGIDALILNAGAGLYKPFAEWTPDEIDAVLDVNLGAVVHGAHAALPYLNAGASIVLVASDVGRRAIANMGPYVAAKHGVVGFGGSLLREMKGRGVRVTTLLPGVIDTYFNGSHEGAKAEARALPPAHVADTVFWILSQPAHVVLDEVTVHPLGQDF